MEGPSGAKISNRKGMQITAEFPQEILALEYCRNEHKTNIAHMLLCVRDLKDNRARISSVLQGSPTNPCRRSEQLRCSDTLFTISVIRMFTVLSPERGRKIIWNCSFSWHWLVIGKIQAPVGLCRSAGIQTQKKAGLHNSVLGETFLTMGDFPASALLHASLAGLRRTATKDRIILPNTGMAPQIFN